MSSRWHEDTDLELNTPEMVLEAMERNPSNRPEYFPLRADEMRAGIG